MYKLHRNKEKIKEIILIILHLWKINYLKNQINSPILWENHLSIKRVLSNLGKICQQVLSHLTKENLLLKHARLLPDFLIENRLIKVITILIKQSS